MWINGPESKPNFRIKAKPKWKIFRFQHFSYWIWISYQFGKRFFLKKFKYECKTFKRRDENRNPTKGEWNRKLISKWEKKLETPYWGFKESMEQSFWVVRNSVWTPTSGWQGKSPAPICICFCWLMNYSASRSHGRH